MGDRLWSPMVDHTVLRAEDCHDDRLCLHWFSALSKTEGATSLGWAQLVANSSQLPKQTLRNGRLVAATALAGLFASTSNVQPHGNLQLIDAESSITENSNVQQWLRQQSSGHRWLAHVTSHSLVLPGGLAISSAPLTVLDLSGGCCRGPAGIGVPKRYRHVPAPIEALWWLSTRLPLYKVEQYRWVRKKNVRMLAYDAHTAMEHEWLYVCMHSHGSTYFHGLAEGAPRLLWGVRLLRANPEIRVLTGASSVVQILSLLGLEGRAAPLFKSSAVFARKLTIPPAAEAPHPSTKQSSVHLLRALRNDVAARVASSAARSGEPPKPNGITVIRRVARGKKNARAMLNHEELMSVMRTILQPDGTPLGEYPPDGSVALAAATWGSSRMMIAPHGAGTTNMLFMPPQSVVVELLAVGQKGRIYGALAKMSGHHYVSCEYDRSESAFQPQLAWVHEDDNFVLPMPWFLRCIQRGLNGTRGTRASPWSEEVWQNIDMLLAHNKTHPPAWLPKRKLSHKRKPSSGR